MIQVLPLYMQTVQLPAQPFELLFSEPPALTREVTWQARQWLEYQIDVDCTMTVLGDSPADCVMWLCGGGGAGIRAILNSCSSPGGGGGYCTQRTGELITGTLTIGAGGLGGQTGGDAPIGKPTIYTAPSVGLTLTANGGNRPMFAGTGSAAAGLPVIGGNGGSGGGRGYARSYNSYTTPGVGQGTTTVPFGDTVNHVPLCAGGAAGGFWYSGSYKSVGCDGGSDGSNGMTVPRTGSHAGGIGGIYGGGNGGNADAAPSSGLPGTAYGAGGGGGASNHTSDKVTQGGAGYKGVVMIRIPL